MDKRVEFNLISVLRPHLMGIATLMILFCHAEPRIIVGAAMPNALSWLLKWGNYGVDLFLLLSGFGLYFSLKNTSSVVQWYKKRFSRILIPYLIISFVYYIYYCMVNNLGIVDFFLYLSTIGFWLDHIGAWFVALLLPLYALTPLYDRLYAKTEYQGALTLCSIVLIAVLCTIKTDSEILNNIVFAASRVPGFLIGYYLGG